MMKHLILLIAVFLINPLFGQNGPDNSLKKLTGTISKEYSTFESPIIINYKIHPYGGSGNYQYRWRIKGGEYNLYSNSTNYTLPFVCSENTRPECTVFCEIKDTETGKTVKTEIIHPVEFCLNNN